MATILSLYSAALHEAILLVFVPFPYDVHFLSFENRHVFESHSESVVHFRERIRAYRIGTGCLCTSLLALDTCKKLSRLPNTGVSRL